MASELDNLRERVATQMRSIYTEAVVDHALNPRNMGQIPTADGFARVTGSCGDTIQIWLTVKGDRIANATFLSDGCAATIASASMVTELVKGKSAPEALSINRQDVLDALGGLPEGNVHCALLAANTLRETVKDYLALRREPWKKAYRRE